MQLCILRTDNDVPIPLSSQSRFSYFIPMPGLFKDSRERSVASVRDLIRPALTIVRDESSNGHGLHRVFGDADCGAVNGSRDTEQNYPIVCTERCRQFFHDLPASLSLTARAQQSDAVIWLSGFDPATSHLPKLSAIVPPIASKTAWGSSPPTRLRLPNCQPG